MLSEGEHEETIVYADIGRDLNLFLVIVYHKLLVTSLSHALSFLGILTNTWL